VTPTLPVYRTDRACDACRESNGVATAPSMTRTSDRQRTTCRGSGSASRRIAATRP
jgi:hypothetical protein